MSNQNISLGKKITAVVRSSDEVRAFYDDGTVVEHAVLDGGDGSWVLKSGLVEQTVVVQRGSRDEVMRTLETLRSQLEGSREAGAPSAERRNGSKKMVAAGIASALIAAVAAASFVFVVLEDTYPQRDVQSGVADGSAAPPKTAAVIPDIASPQPLPQAPRASEAVPTDIGGPSFDMSPEEARRALRAVQDIRRAVESGQPVSQQMMDRLPSHLAERLRQSGLEADPNAPSAVVEIERRYRAKDAYGIPNIPDRNSWAATGGNVVLPLPGGGTIEKPEDLHDFGLEP